MWRRPKPKMTATENFHSVDEKFGFCHQASEKTSNVQQQLNTVSFAYAKNNGGCRSHKNDMRIDVRKKRNEWRRSQMNIIAISTISIRELKMLFQVECKMLCLQQLQCSTLAEKRWSLTDEFFSATEPKKNSQTQWMRMPTKNKPRRYTAAKS